MDIEKLIEAVRLCGSTPKADQCKQCAYWSGGDMSKCIPRMTTDAATALSTLQIENQALRNAANGFKAENEKLRAELEQVKREREAAVADLEHLMLVVNSGECCTMCKHDHEHLTGPCAGQSTRCEPEWRGPKKGY